MVLGFYCRPLSENFREKVYVCGTPAVFAMMMDMKHLFSLLMLFVVLSLSGCRVSDVREMTVKVPAMASEEDAQRIRKALAPLNGVNKELAVFDTKEHQITLTYDSMMIAHKNIEIAIAEAGYEANGIPAIRAATK